MQRANKRREDLSYFAVLTVSYNRSRYTHTKKVAPISYYSVLTAVTSRISNKEFQCRSVIRKLAALCIRSWKAWLTLIGSARTLSQYLSQCYKFSPAKFCVCVCVCVCDACAHLCAQGMLRVWDLLRHIPPTQCLNTNSDYFNTACTVHCIIINLYSQIYMH